MPDVQLLVTAPGESDGYQTPFCQARGATRSGFVHPVGFSQWLSTRQLAAGSMLEWAGDHGDEALYLVSGLLEVDGASCHPQGAVIIESGAPATVLAVVDSTVVHVGSSTASVPEDGPFGTVERDHHGVHVIGPEGLSGIGHDPESSSSYCYYANGTCATCRIVFFRVWGDSPSVSSSHSHSQDELIHVIDGELHVGPMTVTSGMTIAIPADRRYGFRTPGPWAFLNFRRDVSYMTRNPKEPAIMESAVPAD